MDDKISHKERSLRKSTFTKLYEEIIAISTKIQMCQKLEELPGVGSITSTALIAAVSNSRDFKYGRQFAALFGLVSRQESSDGKTVFKWHH